MVKRILVPSTVAAAMFALSIGIAHAAATPELRAELQHSQVREGEPVRLTLRTDADAEAPDLTPLEQDFEILGTQQSQRLQITNGRAESSRDWIVTLMPKHQGAVQIPAIRAGDAVSEPLELTVADATPPPSRNDAPDIFVESEVDDAAPYVQGEVRYTVRVFDGVGMLDGSLTEPSAQDLRVTPVGEAHTYETTVKGRRYHVHERQYAISPLRSGDVTIPGLTLEARVPSQGRRGDRSGGSLFEEMFGEDPFAGFPGGGFDPSFMDGFFGGGQSLRLRSNPVSLAVRARPGDAGQGWFLPARKVELVESFSPEHPTFQVGEVVRRTLTLRALGASSEQLPRFAIPEVDGARIYDEGSRDRSAPSDEGTVSILERTVGIVPTRAGTVTLPAIEVEWFDVAAGEKRTASLPAHTIEVSPAAGQASPQQAAASAKAAEPAPAAAPAAREPAAAQAPSPASVSAPVPAAMEAERTWLWPLAVVIAFGVGVGSAIVLLRRGRPAASLPGVPAGNGDASLRKITRDLRRACDAGEALSAREALVRWARTSFPGITAITPAGLAERLGSARLAAAVRDLDRAIYARESGGWRGTELWQAFREASRTDDVAGDDAPELRALYPDLTRA